MADFKYYLSRQGPKGEPGAKGEKGDNGNTPVFSDGINTPTVYTMQIDMGDGNVFETQNLKYPMRDDGGNYLRYDRTDSTVTLSTPNIADLQRTMGEVTLASVSDVENEDAQDTDAVSMELRNADQLALDNEIDRIDRDIDTVNDKVDREIQNRQDADTQLTNKINTDVGNEATSRSNADTALSGRIDGLDSSKANKSDVYTKGQTDTLLSGKANTVHTHTLSQITNAGSLAGKNTVDYSTEVTNKPIIGNGTITITQGGVTKGTFTTNQSGDSTIALDAGGGGGTTYTAGDGINITNSVISVKVDNDSIYVNQDGELVANLEDIEDALEAILGGDASIFNDYYTKTQSDSRYVQGSTLATVATSGSYDDLSDKPTIPSTINMVTTDTNQAITGEKSFTNGIKFSSGSSYGFYPNGNNITVNGGGNSNRLNLTPTLIYINGSSNRYVEIGQDSGLRVLDNSKGLRIYAATESGNTRGYIQKVGSSTLDDKIFTFKSTSDISYPSFSELNDFILEKGMLDGTTIQYNTTSGKVEVIGGGGGGGSGTPTVNFESRGGLITALDCIHDNGGIFPGYAHVDEITLPVAGEGILQVEGCFKGDAIMDQPFFYSLTDKTSGCNVYLNNSSLKEWNGTSDTVFSASVPLSIVNTSVTAADRYKTFRFIHRLEISNNTLTFKYKYAGDSGFTTLGTYTITDFDSDKWELSLLGDDWAGRSCKGSIYFDNTFIADGNGNILWKPLGQE